tara:strand:+ start:2668 stop:3828 length:1161 start_codon:yes stop_codon:yes gene_type:complete
MSMINDMLRDLDKRKAPELGGGQIAPQESLIGPQASAYPKVVLIVFILLLIGFLAYFFLFENTLDIPPQTEYEVVNGLAFDFVTSDKQPESVTGDVEQVKITSIDSKVEPQIRQKQAVQKQAIQVERIEREITEPTPIKLVDSSEKVIPKISAPVESDVKKKKVNAIKEVNVQEVQTLTISQEPKSMGVKLSPVALDQQMAEKALLLMSQYKQLEAYRELYDFIGEHDEDMESRTVLASYLLNENRMAEVGDILLNAPLNKSPKLRQIKARWYVQQGKHNLALYTLSADLPDVANYPEYYVLLAAYYQRYGTAKEAKKTYSVLVDYDETVADWWAGLGLAADRNNEKEKALYAYQQALELSGLSPELLTFVKPRLKQLQVAQAGLK